MTNLELSELGLSPGGRFAGRYDVVRRLGSGGMAVVFEARDISLNLDRVALKIFSPSESEGDKALMSRFRNEVVITRKLTHPNIVRTYDFAELPNGLAYMTMEYVDGNSLDQLLRKLPDSRLDIEAAFRVISEIAEAIHYAHQHGVIHRDLKPGNVLMSEQGQVKVTDFGLAQTMEARERLTMTGECVGTPAYMSPEQVLGKPADRRSDIYALGMIAFEIATGNIPFRKKGWFELANQIVNEPIPPFASKESEIPDWYESVVLKATEKDPADRFDSAKALIAAANTRTAFHRTTADDISLSRAFASGSRETSVDERALGRPVTVHSASAVSDPANTIHFSFSIPARAPIWTAALILLFLVFTIGSQGYSSTSDSGESKSERPARVLPLPKAAEGQRPTLRVEAVPELERILENSRTVTADANADLEEQVQLPANGNGPLARFFKEHQEEQERDQSGVKMPPWMRQKLMREKQMREQRQRRMSADKQAAEAQRNADVPSGYRSIR